MDTRRNLRQQLADLQARYADAIDQRDEARETAKSAGFTIKRLAGQVSAAHDEAARLRAKTAGPPASEDLRDARRALMLSERARRALDAQLAAVPAANEALCREAVDRAGTLARRQEVAG